MLYQTFIQRMNKSSPRLPGSGSESLYRLSALTLLRWSQWQALQWLQLEGWAGPHRSWSWHLPWSCIPMKKFKINWMCCFNNWGLSWKGRVRVWSVFMEVFSDNLKRLFQSYSDPRLHPIRGRCGGEDHCTGFTQVDRCRVRNNRIINEEWLLHGLMTQSKA